MATTVSCCCCVFLSSKPPYVSSKTKEIFSTTLALSSKSSISVGTVRPFEAMRTTASSSSDRDKSIMNQGHLDVQITPTRHFSEPFSKCLFARSSVSMVIHGYWTGPDVEDGWDYIEAVVDQVFNF